MQSVNWKVIVILSSTAVYLYLLITEWVDLSPWNDVSVSTSAQKLSGSLVNAVPFGLLTLAFLFDLRMLKIFAIGLFVVWLGVHFVWWWAPYFWGASTEHMEQYARLFSRNYTFLPARGSNPIPIAQYVTLQVLTLINLIIAIISLVSGQRLGK